jgi:Tubulin like
MQKVLIIGLGGSGGKTLAFLMDELKVRLGDGWDGRLPECWKFVHIDVPAVSDGQGSNLASSVASQGGTYAGLASAGVPYSNYDTAAMQVLQNQNPSALDLAARWRPQPSAADAIAVAGGAGAFRAVGRMVTVAKASGIYAALKSAVTDLSSQEANSALSKLNIQLGVDDDGQNSEPLVFIVSSLAGGSGASMVLDVADMVRGLSVSQGFSGQHSAAFLYTADVFASLGIKSGGPGSLATISELISAMNRQTETWTAKEWEALGIGQAAVPGDEVKGRGPAAIFPVGAKSQGIPFGDTPEDVYRGFSRMLAPLFIDANIQNDFYAYVTVNMLNQILAAGDTTGLAKDPITGDIKPAHFSGWGSAVLTMGRERYTEYASQRVAREAVEVLVNGFVDEDFLQKKINLQQAVQRSVDAVYPQFLEIAGLQAVKAADSMPLVNQIVTPGIKNGFASARSMQVASEFNGRSGEITAGALGNFFNRNMQEIKSAAATEGLKAISSWSVDVQRNLEDAFLNISAQRGIRVAVDCLKTLNADLNRIQLDLDTKVASAPPTLEPTLQQGIAAARKLDKSPIVGGGGFAANFIQVYGQELGKQVVRDACTSLSLILADFSKNFITVLADSANKVLAELEFELNRNAKSVVTAAYREAPVCQWPADGSSVPQHFNPAINEVLIDGVTKFPAFFETHVAQAVAPIVGNTVREAARQIITRTRLDKKETGDGFENVVGWNWKRTPLDSHPNINRTRKWQPKELSALDGQPQSAAAFELHLGHKDVISHARTWTALPACPFRQHSDEGIASWLSPAVPLSSQESTEREQLFDQKFRQAINLASPLVEIDNAAVQTIHGADKVGNVYSFSAVPLDISHPSLAALLTSWATTPTGAVNAPALRAAASAATDKGEIFIQGKTASPYLPIVFKSLTEPIRNEWSSAIAGATTSQFWQWRRARPLRHFVPLSQRNLLAFVQGWVVGRITGQIQLVDANDGTGSKTVKVQDPRDGGWLEFPRKLLGVNQLGVPMAAPGADESAWNVPAAILESLPLAMAQCQGLELGPIKPYMAVIQLGTSLKIKPEGNEPVGGPGNIMNPLDIWFAKGPSAGFEPQIKSAQGATPEERRTNATNWLGSIDTYMQNLVNASVTPGNFWTINREYEIAPEISSACKSVIRELARTDLGTSIDGATMVATSGGAASAADAAVSGGEAVEG